MNQLSLAYYALRSERHKLAPAVEELFLEAQNV